jgi:NTP pyrophosphatase (non-canonical NTP hydrolase)
MHFNQYQSLAMRTKGIYEPRVFTEEEQQLICGCMGLCGESGEFVDAVKKFLFHGKPIPDEVLMKELGDNFWYAALICNAKQWSMNDIACLNIKKLEERYPQGFNYFAANNRKPGDN